MDPTTQPPQQPPIPANVDVMIAGPMLIGIMLNWFLYGILVMQTYVYYQCFLEDKLKIKALVYGIFFLDTVQSVLGTVNIFYWFAKGFENLYMFTDPYICPFDVMIMDGIIAFMVQTFFCWRIFVLQKSWFFSGIVFLVALTGFGGAFAAGIGVGIPDGKSDIPLYPQVLWLAANALADTLIAFIMTIIVILINTRIAGPFSLSSQLLRSRSREHQQTDGILVRIVRLTVETNSVTGGPGIQTPLPSSPINHNPIASVAIALLICLLAIPDNPSVAVVPAYALGKLYSSVFRSFTSAHKSSNRYSNALLAVFNNRVYMTSKGLFARSTTTMSNPPSSQQTTRTRLETHKEPCRIEVFREIEVRSDVRSKDFDEKQMLTPTRDINHHAHAV
ncbi:hypothetical protein D9615_006305 [Tricholomella constricta]|uniref:DUF6534 domain-containing protein n=1 Tax=Tricholomella constricta TaxID=117010 RepID=A0A8H5HB93_9AGAR|nr:hypothetical protein D9615_006305 [Tricholomella constricta]